MSYNRVIPRDLFNEANLLKCYGQLYINLEVWSGQRIVLELLDEEGSQGFRVEQDPASGAIFIANVVLWVRGRAYHLERPLNSRNPYPLYLNTDEEDPEVIAVFTDWGSFTDEMETFLRGGK
jgi:hypothetical protein